MPITVTCACGKQLRVKDEAAGKFVQCPACAQTLAVPSPAALTATLPASLPAHPLTTAAAAAMLSEAAPPQPTRRWGVITAFAGLLVAGIGGGVLAGFAFFRPTGSTSGLFQTVAQRSTSAPETHRLPDTPPLPVAPPLVPPVDEREVQRHRQAAAHRDQGVAAYRNQNYDAAIRAFTQAIRLTPNFAEAHRWRGLCYFRKGDHQTAKADLDQAIGLNATDVLAHRLRGEVQAATGNHLAAVRDFDRALELQPGDAAMLWLRAQAQVGQQNFRDAVEDYTRLIQLDPRSVLAYRGRAHAFYHAGLAFGIYGGAQPGDFDKAIADCHEVLKLRPEERTILELRCRAYYAKRDFAKALADADELLKIQPNSSAAHAVRGQSFFERRDFKQAVASLDVALKLDPQDLPSTRARGLACFALGDFAKALPDLTTVIDAGRSTLQPDADVLLSRGMIYNAALNYQAAIPDLTAAIRARQGFAKAYWERSRAYYGLNDRVRGKADYAQALKLDPQVGKQ
ncbi:MAG: tetratricopeptide repeat protein [Planctomycetia bacterium]|nr:tetratricopeptide repeat protein [Planctomycetia bacterium]